MAVFRMSTSNESPSLNQKKGVKASASMVRGICIPLAVLWMTLTLSLNVVLLRRISHDDQTPSPWEKKFTQSLEARPHSQAASLARESSATTTTTTTTTTKSATDVHSNRDSLVVRDNKNSDGFRTNVLVLFSGPRAFAEAGNSDKSVLYWKNFYYFLEHGVTCKEDVIIIVGYSVYAFIDHIVAPVIEDCKKRTGAMVMVMPREDKCYDMESIRLGLSVVNTEDYAYFVVMNLGVTGPKVVEEPHKSWTHVFTDMLQGSVKMAGITINCRGHRNYLDPHVNSFLYAFSYEGLKIALSAGCIYDCHKDEGGDDRWAIISKYEIGMSNAILKAGYSIASLMENVTLNNNNIATCKMPDIWYRHEMYRRLGYVPTLDEFHFFKTSRFVPDEIADQLGYHNAEKIFGEEQAIWDAELMEIALGGRSVMYNMDQPQQPVEVVVVLDNCGASSVGWIEPYFANVHVKEYLIVNMCRNPVLNAPEGARILDFSGVSVFPDYVYATLIRRLVEESDSLTDSRKNDVIFFVHDGKAATQSTYMAEEIVNLAAVHGFGCKKRPFCSPRCRNKYQPTILHLPRFWSAFAVPEGDEATSRRLAEEDDEEEEGVSDLTHHMDLSREQLTLGDHPHPPKGVKDRTRNLGHWNVVELNATLTSNIVPVCYGRSFAFRRTQVLQQPLAMWKKLEEILAEENAIPDDSHFAERSWAAWLSVPYPSEVRAGLLRRSSNYLGRIKKFSPKVWEQEMKGMLLWQL